MRYHEHRSPRHRTPANAGLKKPTNANTWGNVPYAWPYGKAPADLMQHHWYIYWMQAMPGLGNAIPCGSSVMGNWWQYTAEWDTAIISTNANCGLWTTGANGPPNITGGPSNEVVGEGRPPTLTVAPDGLGLTYRWRHNGKEMTNAGTVSGSGTATLTVSAVTKADAGRCHPEETEGFRKGPDACGGRVGQCETSFWRFLGCARASLCL